VHNLRRCRCSSVRMAIGFYAVSFYVFNLRFLDNSAKTLVFLQKFGFQLSDPSTNAHVNRINRACDAVMDTLAKVTVAALPSKKNYLHQDGGFDQGKGKPQVTTDGGNALDSGVD